MLFCGGSIEKIMGSEIKKRKRKKKKQWMNFNYSGFGSLIDGSTAKCTTFPNERITLTLVND